MNDDTKNDDELARMLRAAGPRPLPSDEDTAAAYNAVRSEWRTVVGRKRRRRAMVASALAASVVAALVLFIAPQPDPARVATIDRLDGSIYVASEAGELERVNDLAVLRVGQSLRTGRDSVAGLVLESGGSLRIAGDASLRFASEGIVELRAGSIYVDTDPNPLSGAPGAGEASLVIRTEFGDVTHVGTQYMVNVSNREVVVSVRSGEVILNERSRATAGERLSTNGIDIDRGSVAPFGDTWRWAERASPGIDVDQQTADAFLRWVAHETGFALAYADSATADNAASTVLSGTIDVAPRDALAAWVLAADYAYELDERRGEIRIRRR